MLFLFDWFLDGMPDRTQIGNDCAQFGYGLDRMVANYPQGDPFLSVIRELRNIGRSATVPMIRNNTVSFCHGISGGGRFEWKR